jgi:hypothetical protein
VRRKTGETAICYGVFREVEHSPGREADDAAILKAAGRRLEEGGDGFAVSYRPPGEITGRERILPALAFAMCEGNRALEILGQWERRGVCVINSPRAVIRTHREKLMPLLESRGVPTPDGFLLDCGADALPRGMEADRLFSACWIKQAIEHKTREGDVVFATDRDSVRNALERLRRRGLTRALVERHVDGDLVKFYGVSDAAAAGDGGTRPASWFRWFHPKEHPVVGHAFDANALRDIACRAAGALELDVWGGDAIVGADGAIHVIDVNAWPSFALFREEAAEHIAVNLMARLRTLSKVYA